MLNWCANYLLCWSGLWFISCSSALWTSLRDGRQPDNIMQKNKRKILVRNEGQAFMIWRTLSVEMKKMQNDIQHYITLNMTIDLHSIHEHILLTHLKHTMYFYSTNKMYSTFAYRWVSKGGSIANTILLSTGNLP